VAERKKKIIVGATRAMFHDQSLPLHLWDETCNTTFMFRIPHQILEMMTLEEAYSSKRLDVGHFNIFGSWVYLHVTKYAWKKLESTT